MTKYAQETYRSLAERVQIAETGKNGGPCDAFVSIHHQGSNAFPEFTQSFFWNQDDQAGWKGVFSEQLADYAADRIYSYLTSAYFYSNLGESPVDYYVLRNNDVAPAILGEAAIISDNNHVATLIGTDLCADYADDSNNTIEDEAEAYWAALYDFFYYTAIGTDFWVTPGPSYVQLAWHDNDASSTLTYDIYRGDSCRGPFSYLHTVPGVNGQVDYTYQDATVQYAREYYYYIHVSTGEITQVNGAAPWNLPAPNIPPAPSNVTAVGTPVGDGVADVDLTWSSSASATGYRIYRSILIANWSCGPTVVPRGTVSSPSFHDVDVPMGAPVFYGLVAFNETGISTLTQTDVFLASTAVAGQPASPCPEKLGLSVGLSSGRRHEFQLAVPSSGYYVLDVFNVQGQRVAVLSEGLRRAGYQTAVWDTENTSGRPVAAGVYFARLTGGAETSTARVVVVR